MPSLDFIYSAQCSPFCSAATEKGKGIERLI